MLGGMVRVCARERAREKESESEREREREIGHTIERERGWAERVRDGPRIMLEGCDPLRSFHSGCDNVFAYATRPFV